MIYILSIKLIKLYLVVNKVIYSSHKSYFGKVTLIVNHLLVLLFLNLVVQVKKSQQKRLLLSIGKEERYINNNFKHMLKVLNNKFKRLMLKLSQLKMLS